MKKTILLIGLIVVGIIVSFIVWWQLEKQSSGILSPLGSLRKISEPTAKPLEKYAFENLKKRGGKPSEIKLEKELSKGPAFTSYLFSYTSEDRKITGLVNIPNRGLKSASPKTKKEDKFPVIVMLRGYVDQEIYQTGMGTRRAGEFYANHGFITLAPDFLGYGESDMPPNNVWEERFLRLTSVLDLLVSIRTLPQADPQKVCLWGHSNGGMIALSILEISDQNYPTSLWAPVSQFFPYDILYYTYEFEDKGKALRRSLAEFEKDYDANKFSFDEYLEWIEASFIIHQGTEDKYIPLSWTNDLVKKLKKLGKKVTYFTYPGVDHNFKSVFNKVVERDLEFYKKRLELKEK